MTSEIPPIILGVIQDGQACIYVDGSLAAIYQKDYEIIGVAKDAMNGLVRVPDPHGEEPHDWCDHRALLIFASNCARRASEMVN